jgi:hypothetical protein
VQAVAARTFVGNPLQLPSPRGGIALVAGFLDRPQSCAAQVEMLRSLPAAQGVESISQTAAQAGRLRQWMTTEPSLESLGSPEGVGFRVQGLSSEICVLIAAIEADAKGMGAKTWLVSEAASGILRGAIGGAGGAGGAELLRAAVGEHAPGAGILMTQGALRGEMSEPSAVAARIKAELDPGATFGTLGA